MANIPKQPTVPPMPESQEVKEFRKKWLMRDTNNVELTWFDYNTSLCGLSSIDYIGSCSFENVKYEEGQIIADLVLNNAVIQDVDLKLSLEESKEEVKDKTFDEVIDMMNAMREEIEDLREKLRKERKKRKRWKRKFLELRQAINKMEDLS